MWKPQVDRNWYGESWGTWGQGKCWKRPENTLRLSCRWQQEKSGGRWPDRSYSFPPCSFSFCLRLFLLITPFSLISPFMSYILCNHTKSRTHKWDEPWYLLFEDWLISLNMILSNYIQFSTNGMISFLMADINSTAYIYYIFFIHSCIFITDFHRDGLTNPNAMWFIFYVLIPSNHFKWISTGYLQLNSPVKHIIQTESEHRSAHPRWMLLYYIVYRKTDITFAIVHLWSV